MNLGKFINDYKDVSVGFLFGYLAYNESTRENSEFETGLEKTLHLISWVLIGGVAYQYTFEKKVPPENKVRFFAGVISGICHNHLLTHKQSQN